MPHTLEKLVKEVNKLTKKNNHQEIIKVLDDDNLIYKNIDLLTAKARALLSLDRFEAGLDILEKGLALFPNNIHILLLRANFENFTEAVETFKAVLVIEPMNFYALARLGLLYSKVLMFKEAKRYLDLAVSVNGYQYYGHYCRALMHIEYKQYRKALEDLSFSIRFRPDFAAAHRARAGVWFDKGEYAQALRGYKKALLLDENQESIYYNRAKIYMFQNKYELALQDFKKFVELETDPENYFRKGAVSEIEKLEKKLANSWFEKIDLLVTDIKSILSFDEPCLTHYTSMSAAREMILNSSLFRISEGSFLNDTSEGRELLSFLSYTPEKTTNDDTILEHFVEKPFIGSFVADTKHNDLALWRMYGKEAQAEAKGCALTISRQGFLDSIKSHIKSNIIKDSTNPIRNNEGSSKKIFVLNDKAEKGQRDFVPYEYSDSDGAKHYTLQEILTISNLDDLPEANEKFTFYNVAYRTKDEFLIPGASDQKINSLNKKLRELKKEIHILTDDQKHGIGKLMNDIAYLFKSAEYQYEHEVRLVVQGVGIKKQINMSSTPPRVFIELANIVPVLDSITLGPKVESADEWASAFNYFIKEAQPDKPTNVKIVISHLPFK